ncbi:T3SS effector HopA1 family protein [Nostoc sp. FACHB-280]|uniref:T3SS effector HopA1 family protein n=1 Tax=Nostoc sp. FACHB-280 TaxID=2692839 RepID=UPI00168B866A|nr:T3SS effector HopA1 family protein [Nostoc sp. FACHB-280]MBD2495835.1 hypothetical protein [Nostoc sp. FACHB-280]
MQLLETAVTEQLLEVLQNIVQKVQIKSDFSIHHPDFQPLELPVEAVEHFQKMPEDIQQKYFSLHLRSFLYGIYYNGSMRSSLALDSKENALALDLENNTFLGVDMGFYERLHKSNCGKGYFDSGWTVIREEPDGSLVVTNGGLRLHIQREKHLQAPDKVATVGDSVSILLPKNRVQNGFYMAVGNEGFGHSQDSKSQPVTVRIYFNLTPEGAVAVMGSLTQGLNELAVPFSFKVLYNPNDYGRHDSGVLYFDKRDYAAVRQVVKNVYIEHKSDFFSEIPLFTKHLAPGLGLAEEPDKKFAVQESFGMNRCQIIANGLLTAWHQGDDSADGRMQAIFEQFSRLGIDWQRSYLNANSQDIYTVLDVYSSPI